MGQNGLGVLVPAFVFLLAFFALIPLMIWLQKRMVWWAKKPRRPWSWRQSLIGAAIFVGLFAVLNAANSRGSALISVLSSLPMMLVYVPFALVPAIVRTEKCEPACAKCGYDVATLVGEGGPAAPRCPECGHALTGLFGTRTERRIYNKKLMVIIGALYVPVMVTLVGSFRGSGAGYSGLVARISPTGSLVKEIGGSFGGASAEWTELAKRTLSDAQRDELAMALLTRRRALMLFSGSVETTWLVGEFRAGRLGREAAGAMLRRFVSLRAPLADEPQEIRLARDQAWGLDAAFKGWSIFVVRNGVRDAGGVETLPRLETERALSVNELGAIPGTNYDVRASIAGLAALGEVRPGDRTHVWVIAEPRARGAGGGGGGVEGWRSGDGVGRDRGGVSDWGAVRGCGADARQEGRTRGRPSLALRARMWARR